jgi:peptide/nickel transport system permease protein
MYKWILYFLAFIGIFGDFIANEKPLYCKYNDRHYFPVIKPFIIDGKMTSNWKNVSFQKVIFAPVPYTYHTIDRNNMGYKSPFGQQDIQSWKQRHWLGTDAIGRDVLAGIIYGARIALAVGVIAMGIAFFLGLVLGSLGGYFGNDSIYISNYQWFGILIGFIPAIYIAFFGRLYVLWEENTLFHWAISMFLFISILYLFIKTSAVLRQLPFFKNKINFPLDSIVLRIIEIIDSMPTLLLLLSLLAVLKKPSIFWVMAIIGCLNWTGIARLIRGEFLKYKQMAFVDTAKILGFGHWHIITKEILPNAIPPSIVTISFGISGAILLESFLSFLGLGGNPQMVTWGSMLNSARSYFPAWWLALFPGLFIFLTVFSFYKLGEKYNDELDPER